MILPIVSIEEWKKRYGIIGKPVECYMCNKIVEYTTPIAIKGYRGLIAYHDGCCNTPQTYVPISKKLEFWEKFRP